MSRTGLARAMDLTTPSLSRLTQSLANHQLLRELHKLLEEETPIESQDPDYGWPVLHLRVHPSARTAFYGMTDAQDNDADRFVALLRKAGWTGQIRRG